MSEQYIRYINKHVENVGKGYFWIKEHIPHLLKDDYEGQICKNHDASKWIGDEFRAYDAYFYGGNKSFKVVEDFNYAWLTHIHRNPHHWQYWVLINDDPDKGEIILDMPYNYIIEMICDWWAFSWVNENLYEIFDWYEEHKAYMKLSNNTRKTVENILSEIYKELEFEKEKRND